ncbi:hypothetical protein SD415_10185 [Citrobacter braakii]|uniref:hypothetical protein n=1 Tax=Citrobacter TaxID=544 RepID=UPI0030CDF2C9
MTALNKQALRYGDNVLWFLNELAAYDASDIDGGEFDVYGEDRNGLEGCSTIDVTELAADAAKLIEAAEKRIAELESNEIREDGNQFLVVRHPGKTPVIKHCSGDLEEFLRNLIEQDPLVTIDIITHRYYGVGGQWVQDADEYLHMMAAAGIGVKGE